MASSKEARPIGGIYVAQVCPASSPGALGINDRGDPNVCSFWGDTPGSLGLNDHGKPYCLQPAGWAKYIQRAGLGVPAVVTPGIPKRGASTPQQQAAKNNPSQATPKPVGETDKQTSKQPASKFPVEVIAAAQASQQKWGVPASISLAQWALESGFGKSMPAGSNNPFGMKATSGQPSVEAKTNEEVKGKTISIKAPFRKFASLTEAFDEHGRLLATSKYYKKAMEVKDDPDKFAEALTGVYATDSRYDQKLKNLMVGHDLYRYNAAE